MDKQSVNIGRPSITSRTGEEYVPSSKIRSAADIERAAAGVIDVDAKTTTYVVLACIIAASGGVLFGYDGGVTGESTYLISAAYRLPQVIARRQRYLGGY